MNNEGKKKGASKERRSSLRIPVDIWVEEFKGRELYFQRGANISLGGIFLERTIPHPKGTVINLQFTLPDEITPIRLKGEIVNVGEAVTELGMGIRFLDLTEPNRRRIQNFVQRASQKKF